jgi:hypothetical protein
MYRNFYPAAAGVSQYFFGHFLDEPYGMSKIRLWRDGMVERWDIGYEKRKTGYPTRNAESTIFDDARRTPIFCFYPKTTPSKLKPSIQKYAR